MASERCDLSIIIPAYNEAQKIQHDVAAAARFLREERLTGEIIVVDDGSSDGTAEYAHTLTSSTPELTVLSYSPNRGKGHALRFGVARATGRNVMFADAGLCVPYNNAAIGLAMLNMKMCDIAHGSRRMRGSIKKSQPLYRRVGSKVFSIFVYCAMGVPVWISDTQCGFKIYRNEVAQQLYGEAFTDGFMFDTEIVLRALRHGYQILEFPVLWSNDADTRYNPVAGTIRNFRELFRLRLGLFRGDSPSPLATERIPDARESPTASPSTRGLANFS